MKEKLTLVLLAVMLIGNGKAFADDPPFQVKNYRLGATVDELKKVPFEPFPSTARTAQLFEQVGSSKLDDYPSRPHPDNVIAFGMAGPADDLEQDLIGVYMTQLMNPNIHLYGYVPDEVPGSKKRQIAFLSYASHPVSGKFLTVWDGKTERLYKIILNIINPPGPITVGYRTYDSKVPLPAEESEFEAIKNSMIKKYGIPKQLRDGSSEWKIGNTRILFKKPLIAFEDRSLKKFADPPPPPLPKPKPTIDPEKAVKDM